MPVIETVFGSGKDLGVLQMAARAASIFLATLFLIRLSGRRSLGQTSPFDSVVAILLGATASRIIVGASPALPTFAACLVLVLLHRLVGLLDSRWPRLGILFAGRVRTLYTRGEFQTHELRAALLSRQDVLHAARQEWGLASMDRVEAAYLERNGKISFHLHADPAAPDKPQPQ